MAVTKCACLPDLPASELPHKACAFRRFSSKVNGACKVAIPYIEKVYATATKYFGEFVVFWSGWGYEKEPPYTWDEVCAARHLG